jgi:hypothetical protein
VRFRLGWRRVLIAIPILIVIVFAVGYGVLAFLTRNTPPPPSLERAVSPAFQVALDGDWYTSNCQSIKILGGWMLPNQAGFSLPDGRAARILKPVDLTQLEREGHSKGITLDVAGGSESWQIRWAQSMLLLERAGGKPLIFEDRRPGSC